MSNPQNNHRLNRCLKEAGIEPEIFQTFLETVISNPPSIDHPDPKSEFEYGLGLKYAEVLVILIAA